jgi:hypothetical protein
LFEVLNYFIIAVRPSGGGRMTESNSNARNCFPVRRATRIAALWLRVLLFACVVCVFGHIAEAKSKKKSSSKHSTASKKKSQPTTETELKPENYPAEIAGRIRLYNADVREINGVRKKDPKLAKARGEVLKIQKESFEVYTTFMSSMSGRDADKIRKTVSQNGWYKGMPQIAFIASMGLPDDVEGAPSKEGNHLKLMYKSGTYYFEKGRLRSFDKAG